MEKLPVWKLNDIMGAEDLPSIKLYFIKIDRVVSRFQSSTAGKIPQLVRSPERLSKALSQYESISEQLSKPISLAGLIHSVNGTDARAGQLLAYTQERTNAIFSKIAFFDNELSQQAGQLARIVQHKKLRKFRNYIQKVIDGAAHRLSVREEQIFRDKSLSGNAAFVRLYDEQFAHQRYEFRGKSLTQSEALTKLYERDRKVRLDAAVALSKGFASVVDRTALIYNTLILDHQVNNRYFQFDTPEASRHLANEISQSSVDALITAVDRSSSLVARFYRRKAKILGIKQLLDYDRYATIPSPKSLNFSWSEARRIVTESCDEFSVEYGRINRLFFSNNWIHARPMPGKRSGAFCHPVTADLHPFVFMNFTGTTNDVMTLAHELGHAAHFYLARKSGYLNFDIPLTVCETASVFSEMLAFRRLRSEIKDKDVLRALLSQKIEGIFATVFRQVALFKFEREVHRTRGSEGEVSPTRISEIWMDTQRSMFSNSVKFTDGYMNWWTYISHFFHSPFYVYAYAFGELLTLALYTRFIRSNNPSDFAKRYIDMLSMGSSLAPVDLMRPLGVNLSEESVWNDGLQFISDLVDEFESI